MKTWMWWVVGGIAAVELVYYFMFNSWLTPREAIDGLRRMGSGR